MILETVRRLIIEGDVANIKKVMLATYLASTTNPS